MINIINLCTQIESHMTHHPKRYFTFYDRNSHNPPSPPPSCPQVPEFLATALPASSKQNILCWNKNTDNHLISVILMKFLIYF